MILKAQKRLAAQILKGSKKRVRFDTEVLDEIKEAITKQDLRGLIKDKIVTLKQKKGVSRARVKPKSKKRQNAGSRKGKKTARTPSKRAWINKIRLQRTFLRTLRDKDHIAKGTYSKLILRAKGGYFRSKRHIKLYLEENKLFIQKK